LIVVSLPIYPTDQVLVDNDTLVIQGSPSGEIELSKKFSIFLAKYLKQQAVTN
jgi:hypothetical protein